MTTPEAAIDIFQEEQQRQARLREKTQADLRDLDLKLRRLCHELGMETAGVTLPLRAARCLESIRETIDEIDAACEDEFKDVPF
jgi:hypothetical protein